MDRIKKLKIKKQDGTFSDYVPIGADAENIDTTDGESVQLKLNKKPYYYDNVAAMKADNKLKVGDMTITLGYYTANDGGGAEYIIKNSSSKYYEELSNDLLAELIIEDNVINILKIGAKGDNNFDNSSILQYALNHYGSIYIPEGKYKITTPLLVNANQKIFGKTGHYNRTSIYNTHCDAFWLTSDSRFSTIEYLSINGTNDCGAIVFKNDNNNKHNVTRCIFKALSLNNQKYGITDYYINGEAIESAIMTEWNLSFEDISIYYQPDPTTYALYLEGIGSFGLYFENFVTGDSSIHINNSKITFSECNFGFLEGTKFYLGPSAACNFNLCNFECDGTCTTGKLIEANSISLIFSQCNFQHRLTEEANPFFAFGSNTNGVRFINCNFKAINNIQNKFWATVGDEASRYNCLGFYGYNNLYPNFSGSYYSGTYSRGDKAIPVITDTFAAQNQGVTKYSLGIKNNKICYFNGTKWIDANGTEA